MADILRGDVMPQHNQGPASRIWFRDAVSDDAKIVAAIAAAVALLLPLIEKEQNFDEGLARLGLRLQRSRDRADQAAQLGLECIVVIMARQTWRDESDAVQARVREIKKDLGQHESRTIMLSQHEARVFWMARQAER